MPLIALIKATILRIARGNQVTLAVAKEDNCRYQARLTENGTLIS